MIEIDQVSKRYDGAAQGALQDVTLQVETGETLVLLGSSGCGKTTLLKLINRLIEPTAGHIRVDGRDVAELDPVMLRRRMGYVFQGIGLFPHMTVAENVALVLRLEGAEPEARRARAEELLSLVGLAPASFADRYPDALSGGQQQRVGVARALAADPPYLLMDEPFGALDAITREGLQEELQALKTRLGKTIIFVTHDIFEAVALGDRIAVLDRGRLLQVGPPQTLLRMPADPFVRELFEKPVRQLRAFEAVL